MTRGFTLIELLVGVAILAVLAGMSLGVYSLVHNEGAWRATEGRLQALGVEAARVVTNTGFPPQDLMDLSKAIDRPAWVVGGKFVDGWDRPFEYAVKGSSFRIRSAGPDGQPGTGDDLEYKR
jgi:prepilin-type N-terminal cleavage/methylation domain-containing protein